MRIETAKRIPIVSILGNPSRIVGNSYWYYSPLHSEATPSFKVDVSKNLWYDFGIGKGGTIIDLVMLINDCNVSEALKILDAGNHNFSFHSKVDEPKVNAKIINRIVPIKHIALIQYLMSRNINVEIAKLYCHELHYTVKEKSYFAISFPNDAGGYELRNPYAKLCIGKKAITSILKNTSHVKIFEGFIDFLSYWTLKNMACNCDCIVLNSVCNAEKTIPELMKYKRVELYLDNDDAGITTASKLMSKLPNCINQSKHYQEYKDINDYLLKSA
jgi:DNA primase